MGAIRIGVVGCGGIFRNAHVPYLEWRTDRCRVTAVTDLKRGNAEQEAERFGAEVCDGWKALLRRGDVDAVIIATHPKPHCEIAVAAARAKKHVLLEKPMCCTVREADRMIAAAKKARVKLQVAYIMRFRPAKQKLKELLADGTLGKPQLVYCTQIGWFPPKHPWLFIQDESGGMLIEQAIHVFDEWLWLYGGVRSVFARTSQVDVGGTYPGKAKGVANIATAVVEFKRGATGLLSKSWAAEVSSHGEGVICSKGSANFEGGLTWKTHDMAEPRIFAEAVPDDGSYPQVTGTQRQGRYWGFASKGASIAHWLDCIEGKARAATSGAVGRAGIAIAEAAYRSAKLGRPVTLG